MFVWKSWEYLIYSLLLGNLLPAYLYYVPAIEMQTRWMKYPTMIA